MTKLDFLKLQKLKTKCTQTISESTVNTNLRNAHAKQQIQQTIPKLAVNKNQ